MKIERKTREEITQSLKVTGITLLSVEEYEEAKERIALVGDCWWLRSPGGDSCLAAHVNQCGRVSTYGSIVSGTIFVVRPALLIQNLNSFKLKHGDRILDYAEHDWTVISDTMALCDDSIGTHCFHEDWKAPDANDYEQSDVKKFLETWATEKGIICEKKWSETAQPEQRWIPVSERLPDVGEDVLFSVANMYASEGCLRDDGNWWQFRWETVQLKKHVTAWMPLPEPYQEEGEK